MNVTWKQFATLFCAVLAALAVGGCAYPRAGNSYYSGQALRAQSVELGVIENVRPIQIQGPNSGFGAFTGAVAGGFTGSAIGAGTGQAAAIVGGALLGGLIGNAVETDAAKSNGVEVTVRLDSGRMIAVAQQDGGEAFRPGDRVRILSDGYTTRVAR
jgi:outer membrane lipoprotein SlyB